MQIIQQITIAQSPMNGTPVAIKRRVINIIAAVPVAMLMDSHSETGI